MEVTYETEAKVAQKTVGVPVFWANSNPGLRYVRCELPARAIGGHVDSLDKAWQEGRIDSFEGPHVFQMPATRFALDRMYEAIAAGRWVAAEFDDDYTRWDPRYAALSGSSWVRRERDARDQWQPSVEVARTAAKAAHVTIVSTASLAKAYSKVGASTVVCRNSVDPADWPAPQRDENAPFRVLFAAAYNPADFAQVRKAMTWVAAQKNGEAIVFGGHVDWPDVTHIPWVKDDLEAVRAFMCALAPDIGLRPLEPTRFGMGKSDLKVLEYAMCGAMPIVAPYQPYKGWEGHVAYAKNGDEFLSQVQWAYSLREEVTRRAASTLARVLAERTIDREAQAWASALRLS